MQPVLTSTQGLLFLAGYGVLMIGMALLVMLRRKRDTVEFLLANRNVGLKIGAMSIAAAWIWAPALFVSSQKAFEQGLPGAFWFILPNFLALIVFAPLAFRIRKVLPHGYTFPQFIRLRHGKGVHRLYLFQFVGLQLCSFAVQILAGATLIEALFGLSFYLVAVLLIALVLAYTLLGGLRASVVVDFIQMALILAICAMTIPWVIDCAGGLGSVAAGFGGASGSFSNIFDPWVAYSFGISTTIGLLSGPIGDQMHWQRAYALESDSDVIKTFFLAAVIFVLVPLSLSMLGFVAAGKVHEGMWVIGNSQLVGPNTVSLLLPSFMLIAFSVMLLCGLCSTLDSILSALSSMAVADFMMAGSKPDEIDKDAGRRQVRVARIAMVATAIVGFAIASIPRLKVLHLFLFYGTLRAATLIPTVLTLFWPRLTTHATFHSVLFSMLFGAPVMAWGQYKQNPHISVAGSLLVVVIGASLCFVLSSIEKNAGSAK